MRKKREGERERERERERRGEVGGIYSRQTLKCICGPFSQNITGLLVHSNHISSVLVLSRLDLVDVCLAVIQPPVHLHVGRLIK